VPRPSLKPFKKLKKSLSLFHPQNALAPPLQSPFFFFIFFFISPHKGVDPWPMSLALTVRVMAQVGVSISHTDFERHGLAIDDQRLGGVSLIEFAIMQNI